MAGRRCIRSASVRAGTSRLAGRFETINALEGAALETINLGLPEDYWSTYAASMRALTPPQLAGAANKFVRPDALTWVVVGDLKKIEPKVRELEWGEVVVLDSDGKRVR